MTERARIFEERERNKVRLALNFFCHDGESISIRAQILRESWISTMLEAFVEVSTVYSPYLPGGKEG